MFMSNLITFGKYEEKSFEWLFFNAPWYAEWMYAKGVHRNEHLFNEEQGDAFTELMRRASCDGYLQVVWGTYVHADGNFHPPVRGSWLRQSLL